MKLKSKDKAQLFLPKTLTTGGRDNSVIVQINLENIFMKNVLYLLS